MSGDAAGVLGGLREGAALGAVWVVARSASIRRGWRGLPAAFWTGVLAAAAAAAILAGRPAPSPDFLPRLAQTSLALFLLAAGAALLQEAGVPVVDRAWAGSLEGPRRAWVERAAVFGLAVAFFLPDFWAAAAGAGGRAGALGLLPPVLVAALAARRFDRGGIGSFFRVPQILLLLAVAKAAGSAGGAGESLLPPLQRGFMKFAHDLVHQVLVLFMVPDHPLLRVSVWNLVGIFFGSNLAAAASLAALIALPLLFLLRAAVLPLPEPAPAPEARAAGARRRLALAGALAARRREAVPVVLFVALVAVLWLSHPAETLAPVHRPPAAPVVEDRGFVLIPLKDPTMNLWDGRIHKFVLLRGGERIPFFVVKKDENVLAACLDACEVCPAAGYGQRGDHLVCLSCNTPIPLKSAGLPGGCNPIPVEASVGLRAVQIAGEDLSRGWRRAHLAGRSE